MNERLYISLKIVKIVLLIGILWYLCAIFYDKHDICGIAQKRLEQVHNDFSHDGFKTFEFGEYCTTCSKFGENLARGQQDVEQAYREWEASPSHKRNLDGKWSTRCLAQDTYKNKKYFVEIYAN